MHRHCLVLAFDHKRPSAAEPSDDASATTWRPRRRSDVPLVSRGMHVSCTQKRPPFGGLWLKRSRRRPTLPPRLQGSTIGAGGLNFRVRDGTGCFPSAMTTETLGSTRCETCGKRVRVRAPGEPRNSIASASEPSPRPISTGRLNTLPCVHLRPINLVVCEGPYLVDPVGNLILERASHLDAFSAYLFRTWLTSRAAGATTGTPEVRPSRSSRTGDSSPQVSYAHDG